MRRFFVAAISAVGLVLAAQPALAQSATTGSTLTTSVIANDGTTGTTVNKLAKLTSTGAVVSAGTGDTDGVVGIVVSNAGTTGNAQVASDGVVKCAFDGTATNAHFVQISSSVAGDCHDTGSTTRPSGSGQVIGLVQSGGSGAGTYLVKLALGLSTGLAPTPTTNSLGVDVALNSVGTFKDGPCPIINGGGSCAAAGAPAAGTWFASGSISIFNSNADQINCKLWDGTTVMASMPVQDLANIPIGSALSGMIVNPAGNIRISCAPVSTTTGLIKANTSGSAKDSVLTVFRIN